MLKHRIKHQKANLPECHDYLNKFRLLKARCFTQVVEHELVEMAAGGLDYSIRKKLDTQHLRDMAHLIFFQSYHQHNQHHRIQPTYNLRISCRGVQD